MIENAISQRRQRKLASFQSGENAASKDIKKSGFRGLSAGALIFKMLSELRRGYPQRGFKGAAEQMDGGEAGRVRNRGDRIICCFQQFLAFLQLKLQDKLAGRLLDELFETAV